MTEIEHPISFPKISIGFRKMEDDAKLPKRGSAEAAAFDVHASKEFRIAPKSIGQVETGLEISVPQGALAKLASRSGLTVKNGIKVLPIAFLEGSDQTLRVYLMNFSDKEFVGAVGDRIAQLIMHPVPKVELEETEEVDENTEAKENQEPIKIEEPKNTEKAE